jgi:hypothetical protein
MNGQRRRNKMGYQEFLKMFDHMEINTERELKERNEEFSQRLKKKKSAYDNLEPFCLVKKVLAGGYSGGNCWDDTRPDQWEESCHIIQEYKEAFIRDLDKVLIEMYPNVGILQYKKILNLIKEYKYTEYEYYGNSNDYLIFYIELKELYDVIKEGI